MKLFVFLICATAVLAAPADKQKRDILPGDPRYGTEHHHNHHKHHENENEVQISKSAGGYVGSYTVPDNTEDQLFQVQPQSSYGPPNHTPGKVLGNDLFALSDSDKTSASLLLPSTSYGIPDSQTIQEQPKYDVLNVQKSANVVPEVHQEVQQGLPKHAENIPQTISLPQVKVTGTTKNQAVQQISVPLTSSINTFPSFTSYSSFSNIPVKTVDHHVPIQVPHVYHVPVSKHVAVPVPVPHTVEVPKPYYVRVPHPVQVTVNRPYPVEVPRPVPYPVHHLVKDNLPVTQHVVTLDTKANPFQTFLDNTQTAFQNGFPSFPNSFDGFQNVFQNVDLSSFPFISFLPSAPLVPQPSQPTPAPASVHSTDSITVDNASLKSETITKPIVRPVKDKNATPCAGCIVSSSNKQEYVQPTDSKGAYVY